MKFTQFFTMIFTGGIVYALMLLAQPAQADNWPQFRGADSRGVAEGDSLPVTWSSTKNVEWKTDLPGRGWSSPVVWGNKVFLTTAINMGEGEKPKKGLYFGGNRPTPDTVHQWKVYCVDLETGEILWEDLVHEGKPTNAAHLKNSYASETPVTDGERLYVYFGNLGIYCYDMSGKRVWTKEATPNKMRFGWGTAASPVLHKDRLYIINDNDEQSYLMALDKKTGEEIWRADREEGSNWATPYIWENEKRTEIVTPGTDKVRSYDLDGNLLWSLEGMSSITIALPYEHNGLLYVSSGYVGSKMRPVYAIRPGASGDISLAEGETSNKWIAWAQTQAAPYNPSTIIYDDRLYVLYDRSAVACFEAKDGEVVYERERLPRSSGFSASPWAYNGNIFCLNEDGVTFVLKAGDTFEIVETNRLAEDDMGMATPAIVGDRLLIRTAARLYSIRNQGD